MTNNQFKKEILQYQISHALLGIGFKQSNAENYIQWDGFKNTYYDSSYEYSYEVYIDLYDNIVKIIYGENKDIEFNKNIGEYDTLDKFISNVSNILDSYIEWN